MALYTEGGSTLVVETLQNKSIASLRERNTFIGFSQESSRG